MDTSVETKSKKQHELEQVLAELPLHLKIEDRFLLHVLAKRKEQCVQGQSSSQEMTCFLEHNDTAHVARLQTHKSKL